MSAKPRPCPASSTTDPPQDCDMPFCGCDPAWHVALDALVESGGLMPREARELRTSHDALVTALRDLVAAVDAAFPDSDFHPQPEMDNARDALKFAEESTPQ